MTRPANLLVIMSDEHNPKIMGASGHRMVKTPNIDRLAAEGAMFTSAYTTSPVCVPARAAFAVGKYVHQIGYWDNADAYEGAIPSWHHRLRDAGHYVASIAKLHYVELRPRAQRLHRRDPGDAPRGRRRRRRGLDPRRAHRAQGGRQARTGGWAQDNAGAG